MENCHCCLYSVFTIKFYFYTAKVGMDRRKFFFELRPTYQVEDRPSESHFFSFIIGRDLFQGPLDFSTQLPTQAKICGIMWFTEIMSLTITSFSAVPVCHKKQELAKETKAGPL